MVNSKCRPFGVDCLYLYDGQMFHIYNCIVEVKPSHKVRDELRMTCTIHLLLIILSQFLKRPTILISFQNILLITN